MNAPAATGLFLVLAAAGCGKHRTATSDAPRARKGPGNAAVTLAGRILRAQAVVVTAVVVAPPRRLEAAVLPRGASDVDAVAVGIAGAIVAATFAICTR